MKKVFVIVFIIFFKSALVLSQSANSQSSSSQSTLSQAPQGSSTATILTQTTEPSNLSTQLGLNYYEGITQLEAAPRKYFMEASIDLSYKLNARWTSFLSTSVGKSSDEGSTAEASDIVLGASLAGFEISPRLKSTHTATILAPVAETTRETERLQTSVSIINGLGWQALAKLGLSYKLGLTQNFHEFDQNADGRPTIQNRIAHSLGLVWSITPELTASASGAYRIGQTYNGNSRYSFQSALGLDYAITKSMGLSAGVSTEGPALKPNGTDSNITFFNENTSTMRVGVSATL